ncbi:MAG: hypothetical protein Q7S84_02105 [bacterium]|nr:hypothetical protein [bacterium]
MRLKSHISIVLLVLLFPVTLQAQKSLEQIVYATSDHEWNFSGFLDRWGKEYAPRDTKKESDTAGVVYGLYRQLFTPFDLKDKVSFNSDGAINDGYRNVVVPGSFMYYISENGKWDDRNGATKFVIKSFRPKLDFGDTVRVLYLTLKYDTLLKRFLGSKSTKFGSPGIMRPSRATGTSAEREALVKKFLPILHGHWGGYWHLMTMPTMTFVFNPKFDRVEVHFRVGYGGRIVSYEKGADRKWVSVGEHVEWVE